MMTVKGRVKVLILLSVFSCVSLSLIFSIGGINTLKVYSRFAYQQLSGAPVRVEIQITSNNIKKTIS